MPYFSFSNRTALYLFCYRNLPLSSLSSKLDSIAPPDQAKQGLVPQLLRLMDDLKQSSHVIVMGSTDRLQFN